MQYRPDAAELLDAIASLLEGDVITAVPPHLQHQVRVSANLCRILQREATLAPGNDAAERERLAAMSAKARSLGHPQATFDIVKSIRGMLEKSRQQETQTSPPRRG